MAEANTEMEKDDIKLADLFMEGWQLYEELEETTLPFNGIEYQNKVKSSMSSFEKVTRIVSDVGMFSSNELIDEVSTESLQYMLLPFFLGKLTLKLNQEDRLEVLNVAEIYFKDFLKRCQEYELCDEPKRDATDNSNAVTNSGAINEMAHLIRAAHKRNDKIAQYRRKKELEEQIKLMKVAVKNSTVDDEIKRDFFLKFIEKCIIDSNDELKNLEMEKHMVEIRKMRMTAGSDETNSELMQSNDHRRNYNNQHNQHHVNAKPKPLQPFIITRNAAQKAVFGMGYPSLPVMTVGEFYNQRVQEGIFPDAEKVAKMNEALALSATQDPNEKEDEEKAVVEEQIENDDPDNLARMRRMDEYKDVVRRGDGNRHNRS